MSVNKLRWDLKPAEIKELTAKCITDYRRALDSVVQEARPRTWHNTIKPIADAESLFSWRSTTLDFPQHVSADADLRNASSEADKEMSDFLVETSMREDLFQAVDAYAKSGQDLPSVGEDKRFLDRLLRDFKRNGLALQGEAKDRLKAIKKKLSENSIEFSKNLNNDTSFIACTEEELKGMPADWLQGLKKIESGEDAGKYRVTTKYPDQQPLMKLCQVAATRRRMDVAFNNRCAELNTSLAEETFALRHRAAQLLGYADHSEFILEIRMAKKRERVQAFYDDLKPRLDAKADAELAVLSEVR